MAVNAHLQEICSRLLRPSVRPQKMQLLRQVQVQQVEDELQGLKVPYKTALPGTVYELLTYRVVAFTGTRIVNAFAIASVAAPVGAEAQTDVIKDGDCNDQQQVQLPRPRGIKRRRRPVTGRDLLTPPPASLCQAMANSVSCDSQAGVMLFAAVQRGEAPAQLSVEQCMYLLAACKFFLADYLLGLLEASCYLHPVLTKAPLQHVRCM